MSARALVLPIAVVAAIAVGVGALPAMGDDALTPFLPKTAPELSVVRVLAPPDFLDPASIAAFEKDSGTTIALDAYASPAELADHIGDRYDVVLLRGPALARRLSANGLTKLDRRRLPNARLVQAALAAKYAAYDRDGGYGVPFGWSAFGLLYNADKTEAPISWAQALDLRGARRAADCGVVWPDARDETFTAIWRLAGVDPAHARAAELKSATALLDRARATFVAFAAADEVGAFVKGAACIGAGTLGEADAVKQRGGDNAPNVRFAYPREGASLEIYAFAIPRDAASPDASYKLINALLSPDNAERDAMSAGVIGSAETTDLEQLKRLVPEPGFDPAMTAAMQNDWKHLTSGK